MILEVLLSNPSSRLFLTLVKQLRLGQFYQKQNMNNI